MKQHLSVTKILSCLPDQIVATIAQNTKVDYSVSKLTAKTLLELFIYTSLHSKRISQRILSSVYESRRFQTLFGVTGTLSYSTISMRLATMNYQYFEQVFSHLIAHSLITEVCFGNKKIALRTLDSTFVTLSSKLLQCGMCMNPGTKNIKYGVTIQDNIPVSIKLFTNTKEISDNTTFMASLRESPVSINIFDRGLNKFEHFYALQREGILFVTRLQQNVVLSVVSSKHTKSNSTSLLDIRDTRSCLSRDMSQEFRVITGSNKDSGEVLRFITNITFLSAVEITELYKSRWEIEIFFKFIKQELNFSHLLSRNTNGIQVVMYLTMITAILLSVYKKANNLTNWVIIKMKFCEELEMSIVQKWHQEIYLNSAVVDERVSRRGG
jgi:Transposase DDE domain